MLKINEEYRKLIPPLTEEEYKQLEENILNEGIREPIILYKDYIIDGHNRYEIAKKHSLKYVTLSKEFVDETEVKIWMVKNQFGRRNLSTFQRIELVEHLEELFKSRAKENLKLGGMYKTSFEKLDEKLEMVKEIELFQNTNLKNKPWQNSAKASEKVETRNEIAKIAKTSHDTVTRVKKIKKKAAPETIQKLRTGEISINQAYKEIVKEERKKEIQEARNEIAIKVSTVKKSERYNIINADISNVNINDQFDFIITDPPYPKEYIHLYEVLAEKATHWLKPDGLLIAMCGQSYLNEIYILLSKHLKYYWTACYLTPGQPTPLRQVNVNTNWKPLLIFSRKDGKYTGKIFGDVCKSEANDKDFHKWGQSVSGMNDIVKKFCIPGQSILDPFCGAGTTGIAAINNDCLFTGIEIEEANCNISNVRINEAIKN